MKGLIPVGLVVAILFSVQIVLSFERPPMSSVQQGFRGTGMVETYNPREAEELAEINQPPESFGPLEPGGDKASDVYENVQVLGHLSDDEFIGLMALITEWVSPEEGCAYCHNEDNLASDEVYAKGVARRMIEMTWNVNANWTDHVKDTGVTCYTCHRGQPQPQYAWYSETGPAQQTGGFSQSRNNQNVATEVAAYSSLPYDALDRLLAAEGEIRVQPRNGLPIFGQTGSSIQDTEVTYSLMMYMSESLGVNCTFCHNSRAFYKWDESAPQRVRAWHGIQMVRNLNQEYVVPLKPVIPEEHLGVSGDIAKVGCNTCHQGINKPLYGAKMLPDALPLSGPPQ